MSHFQIFGLVFLSGLIAVSVARVLHNRATWRSSLVWLSLWVVAAIAIWHPEFTTSVAKRLGIGRGADLVFYCAILAMLVGFFWIYLRLRQLDAHLTQLTRFLALERAQRDGAAPTKAKE